MVFYYAITNYHILNCILHKLKYNKNKKSVLYISKWHPEHNILAKNIRKTNFFDKVVIFREVTFPSGNNKIGVKKIISDIKYISEEINNNNRIDFDKYEEINICGDHYGLSVFLNYNNIRYNYFEDGSGILSKVNLLMDNIKKIDYSRFLILEYMKLPGNSNCIIKRFGDLNSQLSNYYNEKDVHFSVKEELNKTDNEKLKKMISVFVSSFKVDNLDNYDILLTFHYNNLGILSLEEQRLFYSYLLDFFGHNKIVIKQHPSDIQPEYKKWFPNIRILPRKMPSEFLPSLVKGRFNTAITGWSTSINGLKNKVDNIVNFDGNIDDRYRVLYKYYFISKIIYELFDSSYSIICYGFDVKYINNFMNTFNKNNDYSFFNYDSMDDIINLKNKKIVIYEKVDEILIDYVNRLSKDTIIFEIDDFNNTLLSNDYLVSAVIKKSIIDEKKYVNLNALKYDSFSCVVMDDTMRDKILDFKWKKDLKHTNIKLELVFNVDKKDYIKSNNEKIMVVDDLKKKLNREKEKISLIKNEFKSKIGIFEAQISLLNDKNEKYENEILNLRNELQSIKNSNSWKITKFYRYFGKIIKKIMYRK